MDPEKEKKLQVCLYFSLAYKLLYSKHSQSNKRGRNFTGPKGKEIQWTEEMVVVHLLLLRKGKAMVACGNSWA